MTDAAPTPIPPMTRQRIRVTGPPARPVPIALATNSRPAPTITLMRPYRFASCPAAQAPRAAPSSADATEKPVSPDPIAKSLRNAVTAPLMTAVSNPNMNPPRAATDARWTARVVLNRSSAAGTDGITAPLGESRRSPDAARAVSQASGMPRANMWARQLPPAGRRNSTVRQTGLPAGQVRRADLLRAVGPAARRAAAVGPDCTRPGCAATPTGSASASCAGGEERTHLVPGIHVVDATTADTDRGRPCQYLEHQTLPDLLTLGEPEWPSSARQRVGPRGRRWSARRRTARRARRWCACPLARARRGAPPARV